jgi:hypothetical protein
MSALPSIKGAVFSLAVEELSKLVSAGRISQAELARRLEPGDLELLSGPVQVTQWYDIRVYARLVELLRDVEGDGSDDYLRRRGARSAERLIHAGVYQQLEYLNRLQVTKVQDPQERFLAFARDLRLLTTLSASVYNFMRWESRPDPGHPDRHRIDVSEAGPLPTIFDPHIEGFINRMTAQGGEQDLWCARRARPELLLFEMTRPL